MNVQHLVNKFIPKIEQIIEKRFGKKIDIMNLFEKTKNLLSSSEEAKMLIERIKKILSRK